MEATVGNQWIESYLEALVSEPEGRIGGAMDGRGETKGEAEDEACCPGLPWSQDLSIVCCLL